MKAMRRKAVWLTVPTLIYFLAAGCGEPAARVGRQLAPEIDLGTTIGSLAEVFSFDTIRVEGYALVGGLNQTGSSQCPPQIRNYLEKYILKQFTRPNVDVEKFIDSTDTAVVRVHGLMPAAVSRNQRFDVQVSAVRGTQTTSLRGGELWGADLYEAGKFGLATKVLATAEGPIFIDTIGASAVDKKTGYVLGGGRVLDEYKVGLAIRKPDYRVASLIRNRLSGRFGSETAKALSPGMIELKVPAKYKEQKQRFISIVKTMYLDQRPEITKERIKTFVRKLAVSEQKQESEFTLEAIGNESVGKLAALLNSSDNEIKLRAARIMLNLGDERSLDTLAKIAMDKSSAYRIEALEAITAAAQPEFAASVARRMLRDEDFEVKLASYENLRKLDDISIMRELIGRNFYLERIVQGGEKAIFVSRRGRPRIALFGVPIRCRKDIFVQSEDGDITINAPAGQEYVSIARRHPKRPTIIGPLKSSFELSDIIRTLCDEPVVRMKGKQPGLGVCYSDAIAVLKRMSEQGAVEARFEAGPLPKIE